MIFWFIFVSWVVFEVFLIRLIMLVSEEKKILLKQMKDVKVEINSTSDLLAVTEEDRREEEEPNEPWW